MAAAAPAAPVRRAERRDKRDDKVRVSESSDASPFVLVLSRRIESNDEPDWPPPRKIVALAIGSPASILRFPPNCQHLYWFRWQIRLSVGNHDNTFEFNRGAPLLHIFWLKDAISSTKDRSSLHAMFSRIMCSPVPPVSNAFGRD